MSYKSKYTEEELATMSASVRASAVAFLKERILENPEKAGSAFKDMDRMTLLNMSDEEFCCRVNEAGERARAILAKDKEAVSNDLGTDHT